MFYKADIHVYTYADIHKLIHIHTSRQTCTTYVPYIHTHRHPCSTHTHARKQLSNTKTKTNREEQFYLPGIAFCFMLGWNRTAVCPNGLRFIPVIFFKDSRALRGSLYAPGAGVIVFVSPNLQNQHSKVIQN